MVKGPIGARTLYLAYHRADGDLAHRMHDLAEQLGYFVWRHIPAADEPPGHQLRDHCSARRPESLYLLAVISKDFLLSPWLMRNLRIARDLGVVVLLAKVDELSLPDELQDYRVIEVQGIRARGLHLIHGFFSAEQAPAARLPPGHLLGGVPLADLRLLALDHWDRLDLDELLLGQFIDLETFPVRPNDRLVALLHDVHRVDLAAPLADLLAASVPEAIDEGASEA